ncbi:putative dolichol-phosphate mannosyltransferase catalytic subunit Dpm1 [Monocercomonoides exilis]|uniref:putative dolichol-phosphate mannosyltransferase catalytic subunit Dpm1 n=1 Tax=Monocercomonoides exilis TaxID=2049356 RepID=UPI00355A7888|nr:putative dolichol-phosphate mannosyltransferase catalytic subunit Dpm1 [Monocercomonoides exilis]|eukprot:MONOS_5888.1-p1 / transcript=MONOS_5888.1 / gene=MONOS_5888 / organism=Monocercomonoides_exilis_PA203 / gene_product=dolichol-phosphate mannosyltransferase catalytic subunit Dpm1 / transcript_product=dolichol-phosphate mannosyltransferase catalytic subunit Dpm1 / location=Mono_scaffold00177:66096-67072(+) / protein_length=239 / sequence_SO=supercontig / SO=protein_coding / is_pseudo=false
MSQIDYSIIMPTYNERENLPIIVYLICSEMQKCGENRFEIIIVDDSSPDGTQDVAKQLQTVFPNKIVLKSRKGKLGLGSAYIYGLTFARGDFVIIMDADLSHHPKFIPEMIRLQKKSNLDIVTGTRYRSGGGVCGWSWFRKLTSSGANVLATTAIGNASSDMTGSFRLYRKAVLEKILPEVKAKGFSFQFEIIARAYKKGYTIGEVPITFADRMFGSSKIGMKEYVGFIKTILLLVLTI